MKKSIYLAFAFAFIMAACSKNDTPPTDPATGAPSVTLDSSYTVNVTENIVYGEGLSHDSLNSPTSSVMPLYLDAYIPNNDSENRPALMLIHGGGFTGGTKLQAPLVNLARYFATRGFAVFSVDYRLLGDRGTVPQSWIDSSSSIPSVDIGKFYALYPAHRDSKAALRWIVANADTYNINTDYITIGGGSAGATTSIGVGVSALEDYKDELSLSDDNTLSSTNLSQSYQVQTILDFWGSDNSLEALELIDGITRFGPNSPSLFIAHGTADPTVAFSNAEDLRSICQNNQIPFVFYELTGAGHGPWGATVNGNSLEKLAFDFTTEQQNMTVD